MQYVRILNVNRKYTKNLKFPISIFTGYSKLFQTQIDYECFGTYFSPHSHYIWDRKNKAKKKEKKRM